MIRNNVSVEAESERTGLDVLIVAADRYDHLAGTAELMGDEPGSGRLRAEAARCRALAMALLDDRI